LHKFVVGPNPNYCQVSGPETSYESMILVKITGVHVVRGVMW